jgi:hypothetical protein
MSSFLLLSERGRIPPHTECPFFTLCGNPACHHKGEKHEQEFSCATARAYDLIIRGMLEDAHIYTFKEDSPDDTVPWD